MSTPATKQAGHKGILPAMMGLLKAGLIGFGGGSALIPVISKELVDTCKVMDEDDYIKHTVVANITPGALPTKLGATCGSQLAGPLGAVAGCWLVSLPGVLLTVLIIALFAMMGEAAIVYLNFASIGITVFIVFLLMAYVQKTCATGSARVNWAICALAFLLTCGKEVRECLEAILGLAEGALGTPLFDISMINIMILSFYLIFYIQLAPRRRSVIVPGAVLAGLYALLCGRLAAGWSWAGTARGVLLVLIVLTLAAAAVYRIRRGKGKGGGAKVGVSRGILAAIVIFMVLPFALAGAGAVSGLMPSAAEGMHFLVNILISTVTSFGGGEAYVGIAESIFVQGGFVPASEFYGQVVSVANALPGPILVKIAAGTGFVWGQDNGAMASGVLMAACSATLSAGVCCSVALLVLNFYDALKDSALIRSLKTYILPVICGTLISVSLSMLFQSLRITAGYGFAQPLVIVVLLACIVLTFWLNRRLHVPDIALLLGWIVVSLAVMLLLTRV